MAGTVFLVALFSLFSAAYSATYKCQGVAQYGLTFYGMWSNMTHPNAFPFTPVIGRFSPLVGASHESAYSLWMSGITASEGVKNVAEMGKLLAMFCSILRRTKLNSNRINFKRLVSWIQNFHWTVSRALTDGLACFKTSHSTMCAWVNSSLFTTSEFSTPRWLLQRELQKSNSLDGQNNNFTRASHFWYISLPSLSPGDKFIFLLVLKLDIFLRNSSPSTLFDKMRKLG